MGLVGFYPMPEFYMVFFSYSGPYVLAVLLAGLALAPRAYRFIVNLTQVDNELSVSVAQNVFFRLPWYLLVVLTLYSIGGALSADFSLEAMGVRDYSLNDHLYSQFGLIPVVLITAFPIFFYFIDRLGRYLGPRGICVTAIPLWMKLLMLGIVTPLLIDSLLIGYFYNRTGYFQSETLALWFSLLALAAGGTLLAWRSLRQGLAPLVMFINASSGSVSERAKANLMPLSLDELGMLAARTIELLANEQKLVDDLERSKLLANSVIDNAGALVLVLDRDGRIVRFNHTCEVFSGLTFAEVEGKFPWDTVLPPENAESIRKNAFEALAHKPEELSGNYTNYWVNKNGSRSLIYWSNTVLLDEKGKMENMISVGTDVTERMNIEEKLKRLNIELEQRVEQRTLDYKVARDEAERASAAKSQFLTRMSHEFRTPLNAILGFAQIIDVDMDEPLQPRQKASVDQILKGGWHMLELVNDLLDLAAIESDKVELNTEAVDLSAGIRDSLDIMQPLAKQYDIILINKSKDTCAGLYIQADPVRLKQVLLNLLSNAVKYNLEGGSVTVSCDRAEEGDSVRISVTDTGSGIQEADISVLFEPFSRLYLQTYANEGTGIGLTISKQLVERMGGQIGVTSEPGQGSTFWITLPLAQPSTQAVPTCIAPSVEVSEAANKTTILYIEDSPSHIQLVEAIVNSMPGIQLLSAHTPQLGLELAQAHRPDIIVLDIRLPVMDGFEVLEQLLANEATCEIPVIAVSANAMHREIEKGLRAGFRRYLTKPINVTEFKKVVNELLRDSATLKKIDK